MIHISVVSYLNSLPFVYGLEYYVQPGLIKLEKDSPATCAQKLLSGQVDIGLIPARCLPDLDTYEILSDYCIGANGHVGSVSLLSDVSINTIEKLYVDQESRTSVALGDILLDEWWGVSPKKYQLENETQLNELPNLSGAIVIGDKVLKYAHRFKYNYDLSEEWFKMTGLAFVFAVWVSKNPINKSFLEVFNNALQKGLENRNLISVDKKRDFPHIDVHEYLYKKIDYLLDDKKLKSLELFLAKSKAQNIKA